MESDYRKSLNPPKNANPEPAPMPFARMIHDGWSRNRHAASWGPRLDEEVEPCLRAPARR